MGHNVAVQPQEPAERSPLVTVGCNRGLGLSITNRILLFTSTED